MSTSKNALFSQSPRRFRAGAPSRPILTYSHIRSGSARGASSHSYKNHASRGIQ
jgi:hypothetical protein